MVKAESECQTVKAELTSTKAELEELKIQHKGKEAEVENLSKQIAEVKDKLKTYQDAEAAEKATRIENLVDAAIKDGKISDDSKAEWIQMAQSNLQMVEKTLAGIAPREVISDKIAGDPENVDAAEKSMKTSETEVVEKLNAALGKEFKFKKF